jgi:hypothetical protein
MCMNILLPNGQLSYFPAHHALVSRERVPLSLRSHAQSARRSGSDMLSSYTVPDHDSSYPTVNYWYREQLKTVREPHHQPSPPQTSHLIQQHRRRLAVQRWLGSGRSRQTLFRGKPLSPSVSKTRHGCARIPRATRAHPPPKPFPLGICFARRWYRTRGTRVPSEFQETPYSRNVTYVARSWRESRRGLPAPPAPRRTAPTRVPPRDRSSDGRILWGERSVRSVARPHPR